MSAVTRTWRFPESVEDVWHALTDRDELAAWLLPNDFAPRVGHRFTLRAGEAFGLPHVVHCQVIEIDPPSRLVLGWDLRSGAAGTVVEFTVRPVGDETELRIQHRLVEGVEVRAAAERRVWDWGDDVRRALGSRLRQIGRHSRGEVRS